MTTPAKPFKPGDAYQIFGTEALSPREKVSKRERQRQRDNAELRTARCIKCSAERDRRSSPICERCERSE